MVNLNKIILIITYLTCNTLSAFKINVSKEFPEQDVTNIEFKIFRIPLSILQITQEARVKTHKRPLKKLKEPPATIVVPIHVAAEDENEVSDYIDENDGVTDIATVPDESVVQDEQTEPPQQEVVGQAIRFPCSCLDGQCGCCTGVFLERLRMKACGNISFIPEEFVFDVKFSMNNNTVMRRRVSASDPPPICFNPARAPFVEVCAELSNVHVKDRNAHACLDVDANIGGFSVYSTSFKCFSLGRSGVQTGLKPKPIKKPAGAPTATNLFGNNDSDNDDDDDDDDGILDGDGFFGGGGEGGIFGGSDDAGEGGGILGGGGDDGGIFGGGDDGGFDGPDFDGAFEGVGGLIDA